MQLLILSNDHKEAIADDDDGWQGHVDLLDLTKASRTRLIGLTNLFYNLDISPTGAPFNFRRSPQGKWLSWKNCVSGGRLYYRPAVAMLDGSHFRDLDMDDHETIFWLDEGHIGAILRQRSARSEEDWKIIEVKVYDVQNPKGDHKYQASSLQAKRIVNQYYQTVPTEANISQDDSDQSNFKLDIHRIQDYGRNEAPPLRSYITALPDRAHMLSNCISPHQDAIAVTVRVEQSNPLLMWLHNFLPFIPAKPIITEGLWISHVGEKGLHEVGHVPGRLNASGDPKDQLKSVTWLPDGKHVSFIYKNMLYTVSGVDGNGINR